MPLTLTGHRDALVGCYFSAGDTEAYTVSRDGACFAWEMSDRGEVSGEDEEEEDSAEEKADPMGSWELESKHFFSHHHAKITSSAYHAGSGE